MFCKCITAHIYIYIRIHNICIYIHMHTCISHASMDKFLNEIVWVLQASTSLRVPEIFELRSPCAFRRRVIGLPIGFRRAPNFRLHLRSLFREDMDTATTNQQASRDGTRWDHAFSTCGSPNWRLRVKLFNSLKHACHQCIKQTAQKMLELRNGFWTVP